MKFLLEGITKKHAILIGVLLFFILLFSLYLLVRPAENKIMTKTTNELAPTIIPTDAATAEAIAFFQSDELSPDDKVAKFALLQNTLHGIESGVVFESESVRIEYVKSANVFQAEIISGNVIDAKEEANIFFRRHGISPQGVCKLPLSFYFRRSFEQTQKEDSMDTLPISC